MNNRLLPEDYLEPECPLQCGTGPVRESVPQQRIMDRLDSLMSRKKYTEAERHLLYWMDEAKRCCDERGRLMLCNELVGFYRKTEQKEKALNYADQALALLDDNSRSVSSGTTYVNTATAYGSFGDHERALELFRKACEIYESTANTPRHLLGGLYNNMALSEQALGRFDEAFELYGKAMSVMSQVSGGALEQAITCLNMADAVRDQLGLEAGETRIFELLDQAYELLQDPSLPRDGYYAFVCEKCAPGFSYYGYFAAAEALSSEAKRIYERT